jgi:CRP-like cAMP-binding protein
VIQDLLSRNAREALRRKLSREICVVLYGRLDVYRADAGGAPLSVGSLGPGEWFGDSSALSNQPSLATIEAKTDCVLVVVDAAIFKALYRDEKAFKEMIDAQYKQRALSAHLRVVPLFKYLSARELETIRAGVEFLDLPENATVARQNEVVDAVYLVRSGAVKVTQKDAQGGARIPT